MSYPKTQQRNKFEKVLESTTLVSKRRKKVCVPAWSPEFRTNLGLSV